MPVCQLRIKLRGMSPPVWRRIVIDAEASLANLHQVIQRSMGWEDDQQPRFMIRGRCFNLPQPAGVYYGGAELESSTKSGHARFQPADVAQNRRQACSVLRLSMCCPNSVVERRCPIHQAVTDARGYQRLKRV